MSIETIRRRSCALPELALLALLSGAAGCEERRAPEEAEEPEEQVAPEARQEAAQIFTARCTTCHGELGRGDGPASAGLTPRPRNFQDPEWQESVENDHIERIIVYGGAAVGRSPSMPPNPDLQSKPEVVTALRQHIRQLGQGRVASAEVR
ncbi:MAG: cytochrome c [Sandaracinaceae bacterium]|nr:cytochrome c [Sandaracinaceae bacterium]